MDNYVKTDIDWGRLDELISFVDAAKSNNIKVMNLFLHSYSLMRFDSTFTHYSRNDGNIGKFEEFLQFVSRDPDIEVVTLAELFKEYRRNPSVIIGSDNVPIFEHNVPVFSRAISKLKRKLEELSPAQSS